jgi:L-lactate utilization protein LutC
MNPTQPTYTSLASQSSVEKTIQSLASHLIDSMVVSTKDEALEAIKSMIPKGASVMNGASETLREIGFIDLLKSEDNGWNNVHTAIVAETDPVKQQQLRNDALFADYYLGSVHAIAETGEIMIASNTGSQLPHLVYTSPNIILVVGTQKIVPTLDEAFNRLKTHVVPLEDKRMMKAYNMGTQLSKILIINRASTVSKQKFKVIFVNEKLGF